MSDRYVHTCTPSWALYTGVCVDTCALSVIILTHGYSFFFPESLSYLRKVAKKLLTLVIISLVYLNGRVLQERTTWSKFLGLSS